VSLLQEGVVEAGLQRSRVGSESWRQCREEVHGGEGGGDRGDGDGDYVQLTASELYLEVEVVLAGGGWTKEGMKRAAWED
jgi:hypothetical protein